MANEDPHDSLGGLEAASAEWGPGRAFFARCPSGR